MVVGFSSRLWICPGISDHRHIISVPISLPCLCNVSIQRRTPSPSDGSLLSGSADAIYQQDKLRKVNEQIIHLLNVPTHSKYLRARKATDSGLEVSLLLHSPSDVLRVGARKTGSFNLSSWESNKVKRIGVLSHIR
jgi:hypothetical protein